MVDNYFTDNVCFLSTMMAPSETTVVQKKKLVVKVADYQLIAWSLYKLGAYGTLRRCVVEHEIPTIFVEAHDGITGGNYAGKAVTSLLN